MDVFRVIQLWDISGLGVGPRGGHRNPLRDLLRSLAWPIGSGQKGGTPLDVQLTHKVACARAEKRMPLFSGQWQRGRSPPPFEYMHRIDPGFNQSLDVGGADCIMQRFMRRARASHANGALLPCIFLTARSCIRHGPSSAAIPERLVNAPADHPRELDGPRDFAW
ncbi:hypothetical protein HUJ04_000138 [Dendroctonus ponderosae]|nr:hypothetical protein HUJ04_005306 [Dendroctonus ponderosae]KAH1000219.1 hypothetical protein HUJ04_000138 [Dendroctonus ponderosae]